MYYLLNNILIKNLFIYENILSKYYLWKIINIFKKIFLNLNIQYIFIKIYYLLFFLFFFIKDPKKK